MCRRYRGRVFCWDVVNEPIYVEHGRADNLRKTVFLDQIGPDYLDLAYRAARAADPDAHLVVNEYGLVYETPAQDAKRTAVLRLFTCRRRSRSQHQNRTISGIISLINRRRRCRLAAPLPLHAEQLGTSVRRCHRSESRVCR
jgi:hypothetical protein